MECIGDDERWFARITGLEKLDEFSAIFFVPRSEAKRIQVACVPSCSRDSARYPRKSSTRFHFPRSVRLILTKMVRERKVWITPPTDWWEQEPGGGRNYPLDSASTTRRTVRSARVVGDFGHHVDMVVTGERMQHDKFPLTLTDLSRGGRLGKHVDDGVVTGTALNVQTPLGADTQGLVGSLTRRNPWPCVENVARLHPEISGICWTTKGMQSEVPRNEQ